MLTSYIVAAAIMTPLSGWLAVQMGRKRVFLCSVAGFTVASMLCGLAQSLPEIVLARLLQGLCGLNATVTQQAAMIAYNNNFKLMMLLSLAAIPLVFLLRKASGGVEPVPME